MTTRKTSFFPGNTYHVFNRTNNRELLFKEERHYSYFLQRFRELVSPHVDVWAYCLMPTHFHILLTVKREDEMSVLTPGTGEIPARCGNLTSTGQELIRLSSEIERQISEALKIFEICGGAQANDEILEVCKTSKIWKPALGDALTKARRIQEICQESSIFQSVMPVEKAFKDFFISYTKSINEALNRKGSLFQPNYKRKAVTDDWYLWRLIWYIHHNPVKDGLCDACSNWKWSSFAAIMDDDKPTLVRRDWVLGFFGNRHAFVESHRTDLPEDDLARITDFAES